MPHQKPYGLLCPISRACELLEPRWTIQIITELWNGSTRFNDIRKAVGNISSALLSKRLKELEGLGLIERVVDRATGAVDYLRTEKAIKLEPALHALAEWAQCNIEAEVFLSAADVSTLMWAVRRKIDVSELPKRRTVIRFQFNDEPRPKNSQYWLVSEPGAALPELCIHDPSLEIDLFIETTTISLGAILNGRSTVDDECEAGRFFLSGDASLTRTINRWLRKSMYATFDGIPKFMPEVEPFARALQRT
ncbi:MULTISPECIES: helix-turn-helix domain-containing protein [unclassified Rhizobium]|uniref:winged helix-turn-helix transcriptional regulator n=1 Tax=unclassified Rhizobium TaxID=2613769 RepID=UPI0009E8110A|nr:MULTISPECIES: helix-turn-helix domain-containing protein [unclassified Rhizobium]